LARLSITNKTNDWLNILVKIQFSYNYIVIIFQHKVKRFINKDVTQNLTLDLNIVIHNEARKEQMIPYLEKQYTFLAGHRLPDKLSDSFEYKNTSQPFNFSITLDVLARSIWWIQYRFFDSFIWYFIK
jgi:hypothetical protein